MRVPGQKLSCSGGVLCWFVQDEQSKSRSASGGASVPNGLRGGLLLAAQNISSLGTQVSVYVSYVLLHNPLM